MAKLGIIIARIIGFLFGVVLVLFWPLENLLAIVMVPAGLLLFVWGLTGQWMWQLIGIGKKGR